MEPSLRRDRRGSPRAPLALAIALVLACSGCGSLGTGSRPAWEEPVPPVADAPVVQPGTLHRAELANGLTVLVLEDHRLPRVSLGITVRRGAGAVDPAQAGLAELTAELMNRGAGERDALELARTVDGLGASLSVAAGWDTMAVRLSGLSGDFDALLDILQDIVRAPRLEPQEAAQARAEQLAGIAAARDDPSTLARQAAMRTLYAEHRYGLPLTGTPETVSQLDEAAARDLHERYFVAGNAVLAVAGDVDADEVLARVRSAFGDWSRGETPPETPAPAQPTPPSRRIVIADKPDLVQARIFIGHEGLARADDRRIPANVMNATLGGSGFSSRLMKSLRSDEGLTYGVGSGFSLRRQPGPFWVSTFTRVPETRRAVDILLDELTRVTGASPPTDDEVAKAKSYMIGQFGLGLETSEAVMSALVDLSVFGLPDDSLDTFRARVGAVSAERAAAIAQELLHPDRAAIVLLGPAQALAPQFEGLGEIEVVAP